MYRVDRIGTGSRIIGRMGHTGQGKLFSPFFHFLCDIHTVLLTESVKRVIPRFGKWLGEIFCLKG